MENSIKTAAQKPADTNILGYEKIGKLLRIYAIPSIVSMLVNALYNIVHQYACKLPLQYCGSDIYRAGHWIFGNRRNEYHLPADDRLCVLLVDAR